MPLNAELQWWCQYYVATERGQEGYDKCRRDFARLISQNGSPKRDLDDAQLDRIAAVFNNLDHVASSSIITIGGWGW